MRTFRDNQGQQWQIALNVGVCKRLRDRLGVDLLASDEREFGGTLQRLASDVILLVDTLYLLCESQCQERGLSDEQFAERLGGEAIEQGYHVLAEAVSDFFQHPSRKKLRRTLLEQIRRLETTVTEKALHRLDAQDLEATADELIDKALADGPWSTNSPASSDSPPTRSPSENSAGWSAAGSVTGGGTLPS